MNDGVKILTLGILGFLGVKAFAKSNSSKTSSPIPAENKNTDSNSLNKQNTATTFSTGDGYPLKRGSKGPAVLNLQKIMIEYAQLKQLSIANTDAMSLDQNGNPDGIFGPQTERWTVALLNTTVVSKAIFDWLYNQVKSLKTQAIKPAGSTFKVGDLVYAKDKQKANRYRSNLEIKNGSIYLVPTFQQFIDYLKKGFVAKPIDSVDFKHGEVIGRIASITDSKLRIVVTPETDHHVWWLHPLKTHNDYFIFTKEQIFK